MTPPIEINLSEGFLQNWQTAKDYGNQSINSLTSSAQKLHQSLEEKVNTTTSQTIDAVTTTLAQSWDTANQAQNTTSTALKTVITSSVNNLLVQHPTLTQLLQTLGWATNHPIISLVIFLFGLTLLWSMIKAVMRLIETASLSILRVPLKLIQALIQVVFGWLIKVTNWSIQRMKYNQQSQIIIDSSLLSSKTIYQLKQQRLAEISRRLEVIQQEQQQLLQEAAELIADDKTNIQIPVVELSNRQN